VGPPQTLPKPDPSHRYQRPYEGAAAEADTPDAGPRRAPPARGIMRSGKGGAFSYLVIEPIDPQTPPMTIRMDFFSHADVQTIRNFFGDKLKRYGKKK
jgi:hypothetical protein